LFRLTLKNVLLTLVTAGLYWPDEPLTTLAEETIAAPGLAAGDAAVDAFGLDIGL
jgi:hypothetical protein